jgi:hypothetical protein
MVNEKDYQQAKNRDNDGVMVWCEYENSYGDIWNDFDDVIFVDGEEIDLKKLIDDLKKSEV